MRPRSGLAAKHGVTVLNSPGTIDADYRGEIKVILINHGEAPFSIRRGERIAQMVIAPVVQAQLVPAARCRQPSAAAAVSARPAAKSVQIRTNLTQNLRGLKYFVPHFSPPVCVHDLDSYRWTPVGTIVVSIRARRGSTPRARSCVLGQIMSGVVAAMRRNLLSCTSLARNGLSALAISAAAAAGPAEAGDSPTRK